MLDALALELDALIKGDRSVAKRAVLIHEELAIAGHVDIGTEGVRNTLRGRPDAYMKPALCQ
jgi:hypothetical protein